MKILYIANEFRDVQAAARALRSMSPDLTVLWGYSADRAAFWIRENPDLAALIVEVEVDSQACVFLKHARSLGLNAPIVVVLPEGASAPRESLEAGAGDYVAKNESFSRELPAVVTRTIERAQTVSVAPWDLRSEAVLVEAVLGTPTPERGPDNLNASFHQPERNWAVEEPAAIERQEELEESIQREFAAHTELEQTPTHSMAALQDAERREADLISMLAEAAATRHTLERRMADTEAALVATNERVSHERLVAVEQATGRLAELQAQLEQESEKRRTVERFLAHVEAVRDEAERRHATAMTIAATTLAERQAQFETELSQSAAAHDDLRQQLSAIEATLDGAQQALASQAAEVERFARRESELKSMLTDAAAASHTLERRMADTEAALGAANERLVRERLVAAEQATERQTAFQAQLEQEVEKRRSAEDLLARAETARDDADTRHEAAMTTAAALLAERQAQFEAELVEAATARSALGQQAHELEAALDGAKQILASHADEVERLTRREAEAASMLADAATTRNTLEHRLADIETAFKAADERATHDRLAAAESAAKREADLEELIRQERVTRALVEQKLAHVEAAWRDTEEQHTSALTIAATTLAEREAQFETELSQATEARDDLRRQLSDVEAALEHSRRLEVDHREERDGLERGRLAAEAEAGRLSAEHAEAQRNLEEARKDFQRTLDLVSSEYAEAQAKLVSALSERDARLEEQAARHAVSLQAVELDRSQFQDGFHATVAARDHEIERLQKTLKDTALELVSARTRCESLQTNLPELQRQLNESRLETRRQFHRTPVALGRCTRDGALTHFNRAFTDLVGYRNPTELRGTEFANTVFASPDDLTWLIERCLSTHARESVETAWKRKNGERVVVRLSALESAPDLIEIAAEDITDLRALQERLGQAHRMEAVGRLASEIAVTCGNLLRDVHRDGQHLLATISDNAALRQRGERLLDEVTRASSLLQKLAVYGDEQTSVPERVDLNKVLRDLKPVLKQVAGDEVALDLPKLSSPVYVDVKAERVERLLVNLANYGRERMPSGGRLKFELSTVVVNQRFLAQYPSVRPGAHALITVTEVRRAARSEGTLQLGTSATSPDAGATAPEKPGVDLGALQELMGECGGHLWMTVEPAGNMVVKIHLPLRGGDAETPPRGSGLWALGSELWNRVRGSD